MLLASRGSVADSLAVRFVLAWLFSVGDRSDRGAFDEFWRQVIDPRADDYRASGAKTTGASCTPALR